MDINGFRMQASRLHLPRKLRQAIMNEDLYVYLNPGFSQLDCERMVRLNKKGIRPVVVNQPPAIPQPPPIPNLPPGIPMDGKTPIYIIYTSAPPPQSNYDEYEEEDEDENQRPNWVLPLALVLVMIALVAVLVSINPAVIPPAILHLLGG